MNAVDDLRWIFQSKNLLAPTDANSEYDLVPAFWWKSHLSEFSAVLSELEKDPVSLLAHLQHRRSLTRLGIYFESLIEFFLKNCFSFSGVQNGIQIQSDQNNQTTGELDFVFFDLREARWIHWEVAVKFYLYDPETDLFWGQGLQDRLDIKLSRILNHQLPLGRKLGFRSRTVLKGAVFFPEGLSSFRISQILKKHGLSEALPVLRYFRHCSYPKGTRVLGPLSLKLCAERWMSVPEHWRPAKESFLRNP